MESLIAGVRGLVGVGCLASMLWAGAAVAEPMVHERLAPAELRMDGDFDEWSAMPPLAVDAVGDATGAFDLTRVWAANRGAMVYVGFEITEELNLQSGPREEGTLILRLETPDGSRIDFDFRGRRGWHTPGGDGEPTQISWVDLGLRQMPTFASTAFEIQLDLEAYGAEVGEELTLSFAGSDSLDEAVRFRLSPGHMTPSARPIGAGSLERAAGSAFRLASYNTEHNGLRDEEKPERRVAIHRVVRAAAADVYCFQEEWTASADEIRQVMESINPLGDGGAWHVVFDEGSAVASRHPIVAMPDIAEQRAAGAIVRVGDSAREAVLVYSVHFKCCGSIGSSEDVRRIEEVRAIAAQVEALRAGRLGPEFADYADVPVVIAGDYNLVGSRTPLTILEDLVGVRALELPHMLSDKIYTWYEEGSSFSPGRLDYISATAGVEQVSGFIVNPRHFGPVLSRQMGMRADDVAASDHLLMISDMKFER